MKIGNSGFEVPDSVKIVAAQKVEAPRDAMFVVTSKTGVFTISAYETWREAGDCNASHTWAEYRRRKMAMKHGQGIGKYVFLADTLYQKSVSVYRQRDDGTYAKKEDAVVAEAVHHQYDKLGGYRCAVQGSDYTVELAPIAEIANMLGRHVVNLVLQGNRSRTERVQQVIEADDSYAAHVHMPTQKQPDIAANSNQLAIPGFMA